LAPKSAPPISYLCGHQRPKTVGCVLQLWKRNRQSRSTASPMEWRAPRVSGALHLSALDVPRYYSPLGGSSGAAGGCRTGHGRCRPPLVLVVITRRSPLASTPFQRMSDGLRSGPNPGIQIPPAPEARQSAEGPTSILSARLNIPTRLGAASPSITTSLLRHQNLMQNSHTESN
jgi:hypothetical protein